MSLSRRALMASTLALTGAGFAARAVAQTASQTAPMPVYDEALVNNWQNWSWAKVELSVEAGGAKPLRAEGTPYQAVAFHHDPFDAAPYSKLTFFANGGADGGQSLMVKALVGGKAVDPGVTITLKARTWQPAAVPLKDLLGPGSVAGKMIDGLWFQAGADGAKPFYLDKIQFE